MSRIIDAMDEISTAKSLVNLIEITTLKKAKVGAEA